MSHQITFLSLGCLTKRTRADCFLDEMSRVVPWAELAAAVAPHYQPAGTGLPLTEVELLLRLHCLQLWYNLSDPGLEDAVHDRLSFQRSLGLNQANAPAPIAANLPPTPLPCHFSALKSSRSRKKSLRAHPADPAVSFSEAPQEERRGLRPTSNRLAGC